MNSGADWGLGAYEETTAPDLASLADHLVRIAAPQPGERSVDLGCGTGNATLPLAAAGSQVTAIDPSLRLLGIAAKRAREAGHRITTSVAGVEAIPLPDGDADLVVSNFGIIFSTDLEAAIGEIVRVLAPGGRLVYTAWYPHGPIAEVAMLLRSLASVGTQPAPPAAGADELAWHDPASFAHLIPGGLAAVAVHDAEATFAAESAQAWIEHQAAAHPMWLAARAHVTDDAAWDVMCGRAADILAEHADPGGPFTIRSPYAAIEIHPRG